MKINSRHFHLFISKDLGRLRSDFMVFKPSCLLYIS